MSTFSTKRSYNNLLDEMNPANFSSNFNQVQLFYLGPVIQTITFTPIFTVQVSILYDI